MRSLSVRVLLSFLALAVVTPAFAHDVTISGTQSFASLDGSSSDHDGITNGVFTVKDGNLVIGGVVSCNDDSGSDSGCAMAFAVSGNLTMSAGSALYAENRTGSGTGGTVALTVGGDLALEGNAIISTASRSSSGSAGGKITLLVGGRASLAATSTIDSGSSNAAGGAIALSSGGIATIEGNILSGPSRTFLSTRLSGGPALDGGSSNSVGGAITVGSSTFSEPSVVIGATASIVSQGSDAGAGPVTIEGCGVEVYGLVAALSRKAGQSKVRIRSGRNLVIDGRDLGGSGTRMGRIRADAPTGTAENKGVDLFASGTIDIHGPSGADFVITSLPGLHDPASQGGLIRVISLGDSVHATGNVIDDGQGASGDTGGTVEISASGTVMLGTAAIRSVGDFTTSNPKRGGGAIRIRSYSGDVIWTNGMGEVRPVGSTSSLPLTDQGSIVLTACGSVDISGSTFPVMGAATSVFPEVQTNVCSPAAPSLPSGETPLVICIRPPVANDTAATTNEDVAVIVTLSGSDPDGDPLTFSIVSGPAHGSLGAVLSTSPTTATVHYTPAANFNGADSFVFRANDGNGGIDDATATLTIAPANDPPSFLAGPTVTVLEDSGPQTYASWVSSISAGPADESGQSVTFTVTCSNPSLFTVQPSVSPDGTLTFNAAANAYGSAGITITAHDNGGSANGGNDTSAPQTSTITVSAVNDAPSFLTGGSVTVNEDSGVYSTAWATGISAGPNEGGQAVSFNVSNDNGALFSGQPSIDAAGVLTFRPALNAHGSATVTVSLSDDGGTANGGVNASAPITFTITVVSVNDAPSVVGESYDTVGNTMLEVAASQTQSPAVFVTGSLLSNDSDVDGPNALTASLVAASPGATVVVNPDGTFRYVPPAGFTGATDSFMYSVTDGQAATTGMVTITVKSRVWYVSNNAGGTSGRSSDPFSTMAAAESASTAGDTIYVFTGDGTSTGQNSGFVMKDAQRLLGAGVALTVPVSLNGGPVSAVLAAAGPRPKIGNSSGNAVTAQNITAEIAGVDIAAAVSALRVFTTTSNAGSVRIHDLGVLGALTGVDIESGGTGPLAVSVNNVSVASAGNALNASATSGEARLAVDNSSFSSSSGDGIHLNGGNVVVTSLLNDSVSGNTFGNGFSAANVRFDALPGGVLDLVNGGTLAIGSPGNAVGGIGLAMTNVSGNLDFSNLAVYSDGPAAVAVAGTGALTTLSGTRLGASSGSIGASAGAALSASNATLALTLGSITSANSGSSGISLSAITGSLSAPSGSITNAAAADVNIVASSANVSYGGSIADDLGPLVTIASSTGAMAFNGAISDGNDGDGEGIALTNNTGATIAFAGGLTLSTGANPAFTATGGGTVNVAGTNTAATTTGPAIHIANTSIGAGGVTFQSVNSTASGSNTVIALDTTGSGAFSVTGIGTLDASGGTIANKVGADAITLRNTAGPVTLRNMVIEDMTSSTDAVAGVDTRSGVDAIQGEAVGGGLTLDNTDIRRISDSGVNGSAFSDPGAATATPWNGLVITNCVIEDTNRFSVTNRGDATNEGAVHILGLKGLVSIIGSTFQRAGHGLDIDTDTSGSLDMTVQSSNFLDINKEMPAQLVPRVGLFGIDIRQLGSLQSVIRIGDPAEGNAALGNTFTNDGLASIRIVTEPSATGSLQTVIARNQFSVTDHSSPGVPSGSFAFNFPQGGLNLRPRGSGRYEAIVAANTLDQLMHADGGIGELSIIIEGGDSEFIVRNNIFRLPWDGPVELRADGSSGTQSSAAVQFVNNQYIDGTIGSASDDLGGPAQSPFTPFYVQVRNGGRLDLTGQGEIFPQHDSFSGFAQSFVTQTTNAADRLNLFLQNSKSPAGYRLNQVAGTFNLYRNGSAGGTATQVLQDNGNTGGGGSDNTVPPSVSTGGAITLSPTAPVLPSISIP